MNLEATSWHLTPERRVGETRSFQGSSPHVRRSAHAQRCRVNVDVPRRGAQIGQKEAGRIGIRRKASRGPRVKNTTVQGIRIGGPRGVTTPPHD